MNPLDPNTPTKHKTIDCNLFSFDESADTLEITCGSAAGHTAPVDGAPLTYIIIKYLTFHESGKAKGVKVSKRIN